MVNIGIIKNLITKCDQISKYISNTKIKGGNNNKLYHIYFT